jgi:hypothetical protein
MTQEQTERYRARLERFDWAKHTEARAAVARSLAT